MDKGAILMGYQGLEFSSDSVFLVTGGAGFIGSNLCRALLHMGYTVRCLDNLSTGKQEHVDEFALNPNYKFIKGVINCGIKFYNVVFIRFIYYSRVDWIYCTRSITSFIFTFIWTTCKP